MLRARKKDEGREVRKYGKIRRVRGRDGKEEVWEMRGLLREGETDGRKRESGKEEERRRESGMESEMELRDMPRKNVLRNSKS